MYDLVKIDVPQECQELLHYLLHYRRSSYLGRITSPATKTSSRLGVIKFGEP